MSFWLIEHCPEPVWEQNPPVQLSKSVNEKRNLWITTIELLLPVGVESYYTYEYDSHRLRSLRCVQVQVFFRDTGNTQPSLALDIGMLFTTPFSCLLRSFLISMVSFFLTSFMSDIMQHDQSQFKVVIVKISQFFSKWFDSFAPQYSLVLWLCLVQDVAGYILCQSATRIRL